MLIDQVNSIPNSSFNIPIELEINILERLPVKTLVTITSVCKSWYSIIKTPGTLNHDRNSSIIDHEQEGNALLISRESTNDTEIDCVMISHDLSVVRETFAFNFRSDADSKLENIGSCCNGVVCLSESGYLRHGKEVYLFNPSIRKLKPLPSSSTEDRLDRLKEQGAIVDRFVGFGYDEIADDYKVVKFYRIREGSGSDFKVGAEVYSLRSDTWKTVETSDHVYEFIYRCVSVDNAIYWLCTDCDGQMREVIVAFDFRNEVFREIVLPNDGTLNTFVVSYKGSLAILEIEGSEEEDEYEEGREEMVTVNLWIMKESWSKEFTRLIRRSFEEPVNFTKNGKLIFIKKDSELAIWDPQTQQVVDLGFSDDQYTTVEDYIESLNLI